MGSRDKKEKQGIASPDFVQAHDLRDEDPEQSAGILVWLASPDFVQAHGLRDQDPEQNSGILVWRSVPGSCSGSWP